MTTYSAPILNSVTLPHIAKDDGYTEWVGVRGGTTILADGTLRRQLVQSANKRRFALRWKALTGTQKTAIETALNSAGSGSVSFTAPTGTAYTVRLDESGDEIQFEAYITAGEMKFNTTPLLLRQE